MGGPHGPSTTARGWRVQRSTKASVWLEWEVKGKAGEEDQGKGTGVFECLAVAFGLDGNHGRDH